MDCLRPDLTTWNVALISAFSCSKSLPNLAGNSQEILEFSQVILRNSLLFQAALGKGMSLFLNLNYEMYVQFNIFVSYRFSQELKLVIYQLS